MRLSDLLMQAAYLGRLKAKPKAKRPAVPRPTYRRATRRYGGVTFVGIPNKIAKRMETH